MVEILFCTHNRLAFTQKTLELLIANTNWDLVDGLHLYDDHSTDGTSEYLRERLTSLAGSKTLGCPAKLVCQRFGGPVAIMKRFIQDVQPDLFAKIDNDTAVPPYWLDVCVDVMVRRPELELLGIEAAFARPAVGATLDCRSPRGYDNAIHIGGIGLMRGEQFVDNWPEPEGDKRFFGFTRWQEQRPQLTKGWLRPALPVAQLDQVPLEPWRSLTANYIARGYSRAWPEYPADWTDVYGWLEDPNGRPPA
jgi:glycosyl transferase family 2